MGSGWSPGGRRAVGWVAAALLFVGACGHETLVLLGQDREGGDGGADPSGVTGGVLGDRPGECTSDGSCDRATQVCDPWLGACVPKCFSDYDCAMPERPRCDPWGHCVECRTLEDCAPRRLRVIACERGLCAECTAQHAEVCPAERPHCDLIAFRCSECTESSHCPAGEICDPWEGVCR